MRSLRVIICLFTFTYFFFGLCLNSYSKDLNQTSDRHEKIVRDVGGVNLLRESLIILGDKSGTNSLSSCFVISTLTSMSQPAIEINWLIEPHNDLTTIRTTSGYVSLGSRAPLKLGSKTYNASERLNRAHFIGAAAPIWLGRALTRNEYFISGVLQDQLNGRSVKVLHIADESGLLVGKDSQQTWYFDATTLIPIRVEYYLPSLTGGGLGQPVFVEFASFAEYAAGLFPTEVSMYRGGTLASKATTLTVTCSKHLHSADYFAVHEKSNR